MNYKIIYMYDNIKGVRLGQRQVSSYIVVQ